MLTRSVMVAVLVTGVAAAALPGCSSAPVRAAAPTTVTLPVPTTVRRSAPTTAATPHTARTAKPAGRRRSVRSVPGYDDTTPPPVIRATGTDYPAIALSLMQYRDWLLVHHPDSALAGEIYERGATYDTLVADLDRIRKQRQTIISVEQHFAFTTSTVRPEVVTLLLHETIVEDKLLDHAHHVVDTKWYDGPNDFVVLMSPDGTGRWRILDLVAGTPSATIVL